MESKVSIKRSSLKERKKFKKSATMPECTSSSNTKHNNHFKHHNPVYYLNNIYWQFNKNHNFVNEFNELELKDLKDTFFAACENGDHSTVFRILDKFKDFNINIKDELGRTPLRLAVENENLDVVKRLLDRSDSQKMREALLLSIYLGHTIIAETILNHSNYKILNEKKLLNDDTDAFWQKPCNEDVQFSPDMTPLILASQYNRTEIVKMLLESGDSITKPHDFHCKCNECSNKFKFDSLRLAQSRLNAYRGLASEIYISLSSPDPILAAFKLGKELRLLAQNEKCFKSEYLQLAENLSLYTVKLLNNIRGKDELEIVLDKTGRENEEKYLRLARLDLALKYKEKPFVAHSNCQQRLIEIWYTGIRNIVKSNNFVIVLLVLLFTIIMPFWFLLYIIAPNLKINRYLRGPCVKFMTHTIAYLSFIIIIMVSSLQFANEEKNRKRFSNEYPNYATLFQNYSNDSTLHYKPDFNDFYIRPTQPSRLDIVIIVYVIGFAWHETKQIYYEGIKDYLLEWNNIIDWSMIISYMCSFMLKFITMFIVNAQIEKIESLQFWERVMNLNESNIDQQKEVYNVFYWLNCDRFYWHSLDPINISEGLFAASNIFSICRICFTLTGNHHFGPLHISLGRMISDIVKFIFIFSIIFAAFLFSLNNLFWYYQSDVRNHVEVVTHYDEERREKTTNAEKQFGTITLTFKTIFWSMFGLGDGNYIQLAPFQNYLTENLALALYGSFYIIIIIILLNMLIAMMTESYENIQCQSDIEWKYARSKLYIEFIKGGVGTLPVPFNIIPTPKSIFRIIKQISNSVRCQFFNRTVSLIDQMEGCSSKLTKDNNVTLRYGDSELTYDKVIKRIVNRFILNQQRESSSISDPDLDELKQDLYVMRCDMANNSNVTKKLKDEILKYISILHCDMASLGDKLLHTVNEINYQAGAKFQLNSPNSENNTNSRSEISDHKTEQMSKKLI